MKNKLIKFFISISFLTIILPAGFSQTRIEELSCPKEYYTYIELGNLETIDNELYYSKWGNEEYYGHRSSIKNIYNLIIDCKVKSSLILDSLEIPSKPIITRDQEYLWHFDRTFQPFYIQSVFKHVLEFTIDTRGISEEMKHVKSLDFDIKIYSAKQYGDYKEFQACQINIPLKSNELYHEIRNIELKANEGIYNSYINIKLSKSHCVVGEFPGLKKPLAWYFWDMYFDGELRLNNKIAYERISICHNETYIETTDSIMCTDYHCVNGIIPSYTYQQPVYNTVIEYVPEKVVRSTVYGDYQITTGHKMVTKTVMAGYETVEVPTHVCPICKGKGRIAKVNREDWYAWDLKIVNSIGLQVKIFNPLKGVYEELAKSNDLDCVFYFVNEKNLPIIATYQNADYYLMPIDSAGRPLKKIIINDSVFKL